MNKKLLVLLVAAAVSTTACQEDEQVVVKVAEVETVAVVETMGVMNQAGLNKAADTLDVKFRLLTNVVTDKCDPEKQDGLCFEGQYKIS